MEFTAKQIAVFLGGTVEGDPLVKVSDFAKIEEGAPGTLSFLSNPKYEQFIYTTKSSVVIINSNFVPSAKISSTLIRVPDAYAAIAQLLRLVQESTPRKVGQSSLSHIDDSAQVGDDCYIGEFAVLSKGVSVGDKSQIYPNVFLGDGVKVGNNVTIYANVSVYHDCVIGDNCIIHSGAVIGADGFGFAPEGDTYKKIPQLGNVVIESDVEIGANTTIDRATLGSTKVCSGAKIDNLVQLAHNVEVGSDTVMAAQVGIAGSTKIGRNCVLAGQVGLAGHLSIGDRVVIGAQSGVHTDTESGAVIFGYPALPTKQAFRLAGYYKRLPEMYSTINELKKEIAQLKTEQTK